MPIVLDTLEEPLNEITLLIQLGVEGVLYLEINFIGNAKGVSKKVCKKTFRDKIIMGGFVYG